MFRIIGFYLRVALSAIWLVLACVFSYVPILFSFRDLKNNRRFGNYYGPLAQRILGWRVEMTGREHWGNQAPCIYVLNHQSMIDFPVFARLYPPNTVLIGKKELKYIPFFNLMYIGFGNILIDRKNRSQSVAGLNTAVDILRRRGVSILLFPEGTRNLGGAGLLPFKKGAFYMAVQTQVPIVPIVLPTYRRYFDWKTRVILPAKLYVETLPPIPTAGLTMADVPALMEKTRNLMLDALDRVNERSHPL